MHQETRSPDWVARQRIDRTRLEAGAYKFDEAGDIRGQARISQRELAHVGVAWRRDPEAAWRPARLWDFTSISFGIVVEDQACPAQVGEVIRLRLQISPGQSHETLCEVKNVRQHRESAGKEVSGITASPAAPTGHATKTQGPAGLRLGLRRLDVALPGKAGNEKRDAPRLSIAPGLAMGARLKHPFIYGHWCDLLVSDVNHRMGFSFECHDPALLVFEGMELQIHFELAGVRDLPLKARVAWVHATEAHQVKFGIACLGMDYDLHNRICDFLFASRHWTPARLRESGFRVHQVKSRLRFRTVRTMQDYAEVLHLRRDAYVGAGKKPQDTPPEAMAGRLDGKSRIFMAWHGCDMVGSLTFTFPDREDLMLDSEAGFPDGKYPVPMPPKTDIIEVSRLCIHEAYRSTDLLQGLFEHGMQHFLASGRSWLVTSSVTELLPLYRRIGLKPAGASYLHPSLNNLEHHLLMAHRNTFLLGKGMRLAVWLGLFGDILRFLTAGNRRLFPWHVRLRLAPWLWLQPLVKNLAQARLRRAFKHYMAVMRTSGQTNS